MHVPTCYKRSDLISVFLRSPFSRMFSELSSKHSLLECSQMHKLLFRDKKNLLVEGSLNCLRNIVCRSVNRCICRHLGMRKPPDYELSDLLTDAYVDI